MPDFEILWAPLSRKWQVWQRELDTSGCTIETLISEYSSEGRAAHEAALLRGDLPAGTQYQVPHGRRWFSLPGRRRSDSSLPGAHSPVVTAEARDQSSSVAEPGGTADLDHADDSQSAMGDSHDVSEWQAGLIQRLELARQHTERHEVESIRRILEEALLVVPRAGEGERAA